MNYIIIVESEKRFEVVNSKYEAEESIADMINGGVGAGHIDLYEAKPTNWGIVSTTVVKAGD